MQSVVEDAMAEALLKGTIKEGDRVEVILKNDKITFVSERKTTKKSKSQDMVCV